MIIFIIILYYDNLFKATFTIIIITNLSINLFVERKLESVSRGRV